MILKYDDIVSNLGGTSWGLTRSWTNGQGYAQQNFVGTGMVVDRFSYVPVFAAAGLLPALGAATLFLLAGRIERVKIKSSDASS